METTKILGEEHRWIHAMVDCLERLVEQAVRSGSADFESCSELLYLFESFADGLHQHKEEHVLFPRLLDRAAPAQEAVLRKLVHDHGEEWSHMHRMRAGLQGAVAGQPQALSDFVRAARAYVDLHRRHMDHENRELVGMTERLLTPEDDAEVVRGFRDLEASEGGGRGGVFEQVRVLCGKVGVEV